MPDRFASRRDLAGKIDWEGDIFPALEYGISALDMPEGDIEMVAAWSRLQNAYREARLLADAVMRLLPEPDEDPDD